MGLLDKAVDAAKTVGDKAQEGVRAGKQMIDERVVNQKISDLKEDLGGVVYQQRTGSSPANAEEEIERLVGEISAAEAKLAG